MKSLLIGLLLLLLALPASAQQSDTAAGLAAFRTRGLSLGASRSAMIWTIKEKEDDGVSIPTRNASLSGLGLQLGYGVSQQITIFSSFEFVGGEATSGLFGTINSDRYVLVYLDLGARVFLGRVGDRTRFPVQAALSSVGYATDGVESVLAGGGALTVGAGATHFVTRYLALSTGADFSIGQFTQVDQEHHESYDTQSPVSSLRFRVGLQLYPVRIFKR